MKKVLILVEGQTEEQFIKRLLSDDFKNKGIYLKAIILVKQKKSRAGRIIKEGLRVINGFVFR